MVSNSMVFLLVASIFGCYLIDQVVTSAVINRQQQQAAPAATFMQQVAGPECGSGLYCPDNMFCCITGKWCCVYGCGCQSTGCNC